MVPPVVDETKTVVHVKAAKMRWERSQAFFRVKTQFAWRDEIEVEEVGLAGDEFSGRRVDRSDPSISKCLSGRLQVSPRHHTCQGCFRLLHLTIM